MCKKAMFLLLFICSLPLIGQAQQQMLGLRQGYSLWLSKYGIGQRSLKYADGQHFTWDKELFYRRPINNKALIETSIAYYRFKNTFEENEKPVRFRNDILRWNASFQYDVTYPLLGYMFPFMAGMKSYIGFNVSHHLSFNNKTEELTAAGTTSSKSTHLFVMVGFSYTHVIPISKKLSFSSCLSFSSNSFSKYRLSSNYNPPNKSISWMMGMGYHL